MPTSLRRITQCCVTLYNGLSSTLQTLNKALSKCSGTTLLRPIRAFLVCFTSEFVVANFFADLIKATAVCHHHGSLCWSRVWRIHTPWIAWMLSHICRPNRGDCWIYSTLWTSDLWSMVQRTDGQHLEQFYRPIEQSTDGSRVSGYSEFSQTSVDAHGPSLD